MMNFDQTSYVPVLRWKQGEKSGLNWLSEAAKTRTRPLIELIPPNFKKPDGKSKDPKAAVRLIAEEVDEYWGQSPIFIDLKNVLEAGIESRRNQPHMLELLFESSNRIRPLFPNTSALIPVIWLDASIEYREAVRAVIEDEGIGACIRITEQNIGEVKFATRLEQTLTNLGTEIQDCDLVVDLQVIAASPTSLKDILSAVPQLSKWKTLTLTAGSFPSDLQEYEKDNVYQIARGEWFYYREQTQLLSEGIRMPIYGDYTVQHAIYREPPDHCNPSASIRYAHENYWVLMRGHGLTHKGSLKNDQYPAEAQLLCSMDEFCGEEFSLGDKYIAQSWKCGKKGNPMTWIRAGINHHMEFASSQVAEFAKTSEVQRKKTA